MNINTVSHGKLIVIEGTDGSGKSTQFSALCQRLEAEHRDFTKIVFPQYQEPSSALIRMYLGGEFGTDPNDVNAYAASAFYAVDRFASYRKSWGAVYEGGGLILSDRYTTSNAIHQTCKLPEGAQEGFIRWLEDFEYAKLGLPRPDLVIYLDMPTETAVSMLRSRESATKTHGDIHEVNTEYLGKCHAVARKAAQICGWRTVSCVSEAGQTRGIEEIHEEIWNIVSKTLAK